MELLWWLGAGAAREPGQIRHLPMMVSWPLKLWDRLLIHRVLGKRSNLNPDIASILMMIFSGHRKWWDVRTLAFLPQTLPGVLNSLGGLGRDQMSRILFASSTS